MSAISFDDATLTNVLKIPLRAYFLFLEGDASLLWMGMALSNVSFLLFLAELGGRSNASVSFSLNSDGFLGPSGRCVFAFSRSHLYKRY